MTRKKKKLLPIDLPWQRRKNKINLQRVKIKTLILFLKNKEFELKK